MGLLEGVKNGPPWFVYLFIFLFIFLFIIIIIIIIIKIKIYFHLFTFIYFHFYFSTHLTPFPPPSPGLDMILVNGILVSLYNNLAHLSLLNQDWNNALRHSKAVLALEEDNAKGFVYIY